MSTVLSYRILFEIVLTSHLNEDIKQGKTSPRNDRSKKKKWRIVGMACQKITQTRKGWYISESNCKKPYFYIFTILWKVGMDKALYIYFHFCIILSLFVLFFWYVIPASLSFVQIFSFLVYMIAIYGMNPQSIDKCLVCTLCWEMVELPRQARNCSAISPSIEPWHLPFGRSIWLF